MGRPTPAPLTYAKGTRVGTILNFDRSQHVHFHCPEHPEVVWFSKEPALSRWFPAGDKPGESSLCWETRFCSVPLSDYVLAADYTPTH